MAAITSTGLGSGMDINGLVTKLVDAEKAPVVNRLDKAEATLQAKISAYGTFKSALSSVKDSLGTLGKLQTFQKVNATSSDTASLTATAGVNADQGSYKLEVQKLAQSHALSSKSYDSASAVVGTGTLTIKFGTTQYDSSTDAYQGFTQNADKGTLSLDINSSNNTLTGVRDAINKAAAGVTASIVYNGSGYQLVLNSSDTGAKNSLQISVSDTGDSNNADASGLSALVFNQNATNLSQNQAAQDAQLSINGLVVTSETNTVKEALKGVSINLLQAQAGKTITLDVSQSDTDISSAINNFVGKFNDLVKNVSASASYDSVNKTAGVLLGESAVLSTMSRLRAQISNPVSGLTGSVRSLNDLGIATQKDGTLSFDSSKLSKAYATDRNSVAALFAVIGRPSDSASIYVSSSKDTVAGIYAVNITQAASQAVFTGDTLTGTFPISVDSSNDSLKVKVNGVESGTINLTQGSYASGTDLAAELQSRFNGDSYLKSGGAAVKVSFINNQFQIQSTLYGSASRVEITQVGTNTFSTLGLSAGLGISGVDVAGTIDGNEATGNGQVLTANTGNSKGLSVLMDGTQTGSRGTVNFTRGLIEQFGNLLTSSLDTTGTLAVRAKGLNTSISDITRQRTDLSKRMDTYQTMLYTKFNAMDSIVGKLQATSSYLTQQINALNSANSQK